MGVHEICPAALLAAVRSLSIGRLAPTSKGKGEMAPRAWAPVPVSTLPSHPAIAWRIIGGVRFRVLTERAENKVATLKTNLICVVLLRQAVARNCITLSGGGSTISRRRAAQSSSASRFSSR